MTLIRTISLVIGMCWGVTAFSQMTVDLSGTWRFSLGDRMTWASADYNDTNWEPIQVPSTWEDQGFHGYDGYAWYRIKFDGRLLNERNQYLLNLGYIDDACQIYLNGQLVGFNGGFPPEFYTAYNALNEFTLPNELVNYGGENVLAVRVFDVTLGGGIVGGKPGIYTADYPLDMINLQGVWRFTTQKEPNWASPYLDDSEWGYIIVPGLYRSNNMKHYVDYAWYRKTFYLSQAQLRQEWVVVLGYIDDFDTSMLNGEFIGRTYDGERIGKSESWRQLRTYPVPEGLLKEGKNVLAVQVKDLGIDAGIYRGPIGLVEKSELQRLLRQ